MSNHSILPLDDNRWVKSTDSRPGLAPTIPGSSLGNQVLRVKSQLKSSEMTLSSRIEGCKESICTSRLPGMPLRSLGGDDRFIGNGRHSGVASIDRMTADFAQKWDVIAKDKAVRIVWWIVNGSLRCDLKRF